MVENPGSENARELRIFAPAVGQLEQSSEWLLETGQQRRRVRLPGCDRLRDRLWPLEDRHDPFEAVGGRKGDKSNIQLPIRKLDLSPFSGPSGAFFRSKHIPSRLPSHDRDSR